MRTHEPTVTRDIKVHFERISQLFRSGLPVRTGTVGDGRDGSRPRLRLARAYGDGWGRCQLEAPRFLGLPVRTGTVGS